MDRRKERTCSNETQSNCLTVKSAVRLKYSFCFVCGVWCVYEIFIFDCVFFIFHVCARRTHSNKFQFTYYLIFYEWSFGHKNRSIWFMFIVWNMKLATNTQNTFKTLTFNFSFLNYLVSASRVIRVCQFVVCQFRGLTMNNGFGLTQLSGQVIH